MKGNPNPSPETRFKPGQVANPGGKTSKQKKRELRNAEKATKAQGKLLDALMKDIEDEATLEHIKSEILTLVRDAQNRGLGAPKQQIDAAIATVNRSTVYEPKPDD